MSGHSNWRDIPHKNKRRMTDDDWSELTAHMFVYGAFCGCAFGLLLAWWLG